MILALVLLFQLQAPHLVIAPLKSRCTVRDTTVNYTIIHYDSAPSYRQMRRTLVRRHLSYNYYIQRDGTVVQLMTPKCKASHAGVSYWDGYFMMNQYSIGICLQNIPPTEFTEKQYRSLAWLYKTLGLRWPDVLTKKPIGHSDVAIPWDRKHDPGPQFRWLYLDSLIADSLVLP